MKRTTGTPTQKATNAKKPCQKRDRYSGVSHKSVTSALITLTDALMSTQGLIADIMIWLIEVY
jgi:hypothetical protein